MRASKPQKKIDAEALHLEEMRRDDVDVAVDFVAQNMNKVEGECARRAMEYHYECVACGIDDGRDYYVCRHDAEVIGIVGLHFYAWGPKTNVWLGWFAVANHSRRRGVGRELIRKILDIARDKGYKKLLVETYSSKDFAEARKFYPRVGFRKVGRISQYLPDPADMIVFGMDLDERSSSMTNAWDHGLKSWLRYLIIPVLVCLISPWLSWRLAKVTYDRPGLPIAPNPSTELSGNWRLEYWEGRRLEPADDAGQVGDQMFQEFEAKSPTPHYTGQINIEQDGSRIFGIAMADNRTWRIEGYVDGSSILYIYKDPEHPNSFGSAFVKSAGSGQYIGLYSGSAESFLAEGGRVVARPFMVAGGRVRWTRLDRAAGR